MGLPEDMEGWGRGGGYGILRQYLLAQCPEKVLAVLWTGLSLLVMVLAGQMWNAKQERKNGEEFDNIVLY